MECTNVFTATKFARLEGTMMEIKQEMKRGKKPRKHQKTLWNVNLIGNIRLPS